jgi:hypothetical protein
VPSFGLLVASGTKSLLPYLHHCVHFSYAARWLGYPQHVLKFSSEYERDFLLYTLQQCNLNDFLL